MTELVLAVGPVAEALKELANFAERFGFRAWNLGLLAALSIICWGWKNATVPFIQIGGKRGRLP